MRRCFILFCVISRASLEMQAVHNFYMRKERSNSPSVHSGYVYNQINSQPSTIITFVKKEGREKQFSDKYKSENTSEKSLIPTNTEKIEKAEIKKNPSKRDFLIKEHETEPSNIEATYKKQEYLNDEQDVRTDLSNTNDGWPLFYHSPYEYEPMNFYNELEKAQDKRFIVPEARRIIPVHEHVKEDTIDSHIYSTPEFMYSTDNPFLGEQPFFSYVLNDYFDKTDDDDPSTFKGLAWGKDFDHEMPFFDIDDYAKRIRRLEDEPPSHNKGAETELDKDSLLGNIRDDSFDIQAYKDNTHENKNKENSHSYNNYKGENNRGFKNFADYFANRFGSEDHNNTFSHNIKNNVDKGEKKNGIRKVYHKDEYQEHTEFHDNNNKKGDYENKGKSKIRIGGSEAFLNSQATAETGSDKSRIGKSEDKETQNSLNNNKSKIHKRNYDNFRKYRDVAKTAAMINNADYIDRFMT